MKLKLSFFIFWIQMRILKPSHIQDGRFQLKSVKLFRRKLYNIQKSGKTCISWYSNSNKIFFFCQLINNTFDNFNDIYYCFVLSGAVIESLAGKQLN